MIADNCMLGAMELHRFEASICYLVNLQYISIAMDTYALKYHKFLNIMPY